jgi:hypothetical protein
MMNLETRNRKWIDKGSQKQPGLLDLGQTPRKLIEVINFYFTLVLLDTKEIGFYLKSHHKILGMSFSYL